MKKPGPPAGNHHHRHGRGRASDGLNPGYRDPGYRDDGSELSSDEEDTLTNDESDAAVAGGVVAGPPPVGHPVGSIAESAGFTSSDEVSETAVEEGDGKRVGEHGVEEQEEEEEESVVTTPAGSLAGSSGGSPAPALLDTATSLLHVRQDGGGGGGGSGERSKQPPPPPPPQQQQQQQSDDLDFDDDDDDDDIGAKEDSSVTTEESNVADSVGRGASPLSVLAIASAASIDGKAAATAYGVDAAAAAAAAAQPEAPSDATFRSIATAAGAASGASLSTTTPERSAQRPGGLGIPMRIPGMGMRWKSLSRGGSSSSSSSSSSSGSGSHPSPPLENDNRDWDSPERGTSPAHGDILTTPRLAGAPMDDILSAVVPHLVAAEGLGGIGNVVRHDRNAAARDDDELPSAPLDVAYHGDSGRGGGVSVPAVRSDAGFRRQDNGQGGRRDGDDAAGGAFSGLSSSSSSNSSSRAAGITSTNPPAAGEALAAASRRGGGGSGASGISTGSRGGASAYPSPGGGAVGRRGVIDSFGDDPGMSSHHPVSLEELQMAWRQLEAEGGSDDGHMPGGAAGLDLVLIDGDQGGDGNADIDAARGMVTPPPAANSAKVVHATLTDVAAAEQTRRTPLAVVAAESKEMPLSNQANKGGNWDPFAGLTPAPNLETGGDRSSKTTPRRKGVVEGEPPEDRESGGGKSSASNCFCCCWFAPDAESQQEATTTRSKAVGEDKPTIEMASEAESEKQAEGSTDSRETRRSSNISREQRLVEQSWGEEIEIELV